MLNEVLEFPKLLAVKFSPFLFLVSGGLRDLPTLQELIHTSKPTLNPLEWIPPFKGMYEIITIMSILIFWTILLIQPEKGNKLEL
jgi:hypothetical protein